MVSLEKPERFMSWRKWKEHSLEEYNIKCGSNTKIHEDAVIWSGVTIGDYCSIGPSAYLCKGVTVGSDTQIGPNVETYDDVVIGNSCDIKEGVIIKRSASIMHGVVVPMGAIIPKDFKVTMSKDILVIGGIGTRIGSSQTFIRQGNEIIVCAGCFEGTTNELRDYLNKVTDNVQRKLEYLAAIEFAEKYFEIVANSISRE